MMNVGCLKILLVSPVPPPVGGIASWTKQYLEWAKLNNLNVEIVNTALVGKRLERINSKLKIRDEILRTYNVIHDLMKKIDEFKPHIIHLNTPCGKFGIIRDYICIQIAKIYNVKVIVHYRCNIYDQVKSSRVSRYFLKKGAEIADVNLVLNSTSMEYLKLEANVCSIKVANFIDKSFILQESKFIKERIEIVSFVGHIQKSKGIIEIVETAKRLPDITFKLAGPISDEIYKIETPKNLLYLGSLAKHEVRELLFESDVFLFPSYTEGFANVMLEAMSVGLPIVSTSVGANLDMIESNGGVIVNVGDIVGIVQAIESLKCSKDRLKISRWNVSKVKSEYTTEIIMQQLISIYLDVINFKVR